MSRSRLYSPQSSTLHIQHSHLQTQLFRGTALLHATRSTCHRALMLLCNAGKWHLSTKATDNKPLSNKETQLSFPQLTLINEGPMLLTPMIMIRLQPLGELAQLPPARPGTWLGTPPPTRPGKSTWRVTCRYPVLLHTKRLWAWRGRLPTSRSTLRGQRQRWRWRGGNVLAHHTKCGLNQMLKALCQVLQSPLCPTVNIASLMRALWRWPVRRWAKSPTRTPQAAAASSAVVAQSSG